MRSVGKKEGRWEVMVEVGEGEGSIVEDLMPHIGNEASQHPH